MGKKEVCVVLDSPTNAYYAGTTVTGKVLVSLSKNSKIRGLSVKVWGCAKVSWTEERSETREGRSETIRDTYSGEEEYFSNKFNMLGETELEAGDFSYPFSSPLPPTLPASFDGEHGFIKYSVKAKIDVPWGLDYESKLDFKVVTPLDLNYNPVAKEPVRKESQKTFCCLCCTSGPLTLTLALPHAGYVPGQTIALSLEAENGSNVDVIKIKCQLAKVITWTCNSPSRSQKETFSELVKVYLEGVRQRQSMSWTERLLVPSMPVTNVEACSIIKMVHKIIATAEIGGCHRNLVLEVPLVIGTTPLQGTVAEDAPPPPYPGEPSAPLLDSASSDPPDIGFVVAS